MISLNVHGWSLRFKDPRTEALDVVSRCWTIVPRCNHSCRDDGRRTTTLRSRERRRRRVQRIHPSSPQWWCRSPRQSTYFHGCAYMPVFSKIASYRGMTITDMTPAKTVQTKSTPEFVPLQPPPLAVQNVNAQNGTQSDYMSYLELIKEHHVSEYALERMSWSIASNYSDYLGTWMDHYRREYELDVPYMDVLGYCVSNPDFNNFTGPVGYGMQTLRIADFLGTMYKQGHPQETPKELGSYNGFVFEGYVDVYASKGGAGLASGCRAKQYDQAPEVIRATFPHHRLFEGSADGSFSVHRFHEAMGHAFADGNSFDMGETMPDTLGTVALREAARPLTERSEYLFRTGILNLTEGWIGRCFADDPALPSSSSSGSRTGRKKSNNASNFILWTWFAASAPLSYDPPPSATMTLSASNVAAVFPPSASLTTDGHGQRWFVTQDDNSARRVAACDDLATCDDILLSSVTGMVLVLGPNAAFDDVLVVLSVSPHNDGRSVQFKFTAVGGFAHENISVKLMDFDEGGSGGRGGGENLSEIDANTQMLTFSTQGVASLTTSVNVSDRLLPRHIEVNVSTDPTTFLLRRRLAMVPIVDPNFRLRPHARGVVPHPHPSPENVLALLAEKSAGYQTASRRLYWPRGELATVYVRWWQEPLVPRQGTASPLIVFLCDPSRRTSAVNGTTPFGLFTADTYGKVGMFMSSFNVSGPPALYWQIFYGVDSAHTGKVYTDRLAVFPATTGGDQRPPWWNSSQEVHMRPLPYHSTGTC